MQRAAIRAVREPATAVVAIAARMGASTREALALRTAAALTRARPAVADTELINSLNAD